MGKLEEVMNETLLEIRNMVTETQRTRKVISVVNIVNILTLIVLVVVLIGRMG